MNRQNGVIEEKPSLLLYDFDRVCDSDITNEELPDEYILPEDRIPTCRDQKQFNQCTCFAACNILEILHYIKTGERKLFSTTYMYGRHRGEHMRTMDCGSGKSLMKWLTMLGSIPYEMMPQLMANPQAYDYVRKQNLEELDRIASDSAIVSYVGMNSADDNKKIPQIKKALMTYKYPIWITYEMGPNESHAVALVGWTKKEMVFMNSWGENKSTNNKGIYKVSWNKLKSAYLFLEEDNKPKFPFVDVTEEQWFYHAIHRCYSAGIINGVDETHFEPDGVLTKAQVAQALYKTAIKHSDFNGVVFKDVSNTINFTDVNTTQWFYKAINYGVKKKMFLNNTTIFNPNSYVTREEFCRIIKAYIDAHCNTTKITNKLKKISINNLPFKDVLIQNENYNAILVCYKLGIINGIDETHFAPQSTLTRAQLCQVIYNLIKVIEEVEA